MKKFLVAVLSLALALSVVAPVAASAQTMSAAYAFNTSLTVGSRGADVIALQSFLETKGLLTIPAGVAKGYFGSLTRAAVSAYQVMKGIRPTAGYFGPITRAAVMADLAAMGGVVVTPGPVTCPAGFTCTPVGGSTTPSSGAGIEGTLDVRLASNPADNANVRTQTDVPVYGLEFRARIGDVTVQTLDLKVTVTNGSTSENPSTLINTIKVWDGSTLLATVPVSNVTFTKDQNQVYYYRLSGLNFLVHKDETKTLTVSFSTNSIDTDRTVTIQGYGSSSVRATSGANVSSFYDVSGSAYTRTFTFKKPGNSSLTLSAASTPLRSQNFRVNGVDSLTNVPLVTFNLKSETGDSTLLTVNASTTASGTLPSTLYLYQGSTLLKSKTVTSGGSVSFDNLDSTSGSNVPVNAIQTYTIKADFPSNTANGTFASTTVNSVVYQNPNGNSANASGSAVAGVNQYVYNAAPIFALTSTPTISVTNGGTAGTTTAATATFTFNVTAQGGTMIQLANASTTVVFASTTTNSLSASSVNVVTIPNNNIADGSTASVTVTATLNNNGTVGSGLYNAAITSIQWVVGTTTVTQTYGLDDFKTSAAANFIR
jgi:hypothetical protein